MTGALDGLRVLDLTGPEGHLCGRLLADLGAEVIKVEPPAGDAARHLGPFKDDRPDPEASLSFIYFNTNKLSVALDLSTGDGQAAFRRLAHTADAILETFAPGTLELRGLGFDALRAENPGLIMASITGFGLSGPHRHFSAPGIVCAAMGGVMSLCGSPDRAPLAEPDGQSYHLAAAFAAYGVLLALRDRLRSGRGQRVEVTCQEVQAAQQYLIVNYSANGTILERAGSRSPVGGGMPYGIYPAQDGYCHLVIIAPAHWRRFVSWLGSPEVLTDPIWENRHLRSAAADLIEPLTMEFTQQLPKAELFAQGQGHRITAAPINRPDEFTVDRHALERGMFEETSHPVIGSCRLIRPAFRMSATPARFSRPAPMLGEHTHELLRRAEADLAASHLQADGVRPQASGERPLAGIRVLDFSQAIAGPMLTRTLAENGADVIKVESETHQQRGRARPELDARVLLQQKVTFAETNRNKRTVAVNMGTAEGRQIIRRLVPHCDVIVENFSPRVMEQWDLGYEALRELRRDVIMVRLPGFGITGPYRDYVGLAAVAMGITGVYYLWSYGDVDEPAAPPVWLPDYLSAAFGGVAVLAALRHRDRTGEGQLIDLGQVDATATVLGAAYLDYFVNGRIPQPLGNRHRTWAPQGAYRCKGRDAWCVIAVRDDDEWAALCTTLGRPTWAQDDRFATMAQRMANHDELDVLLEAWTRDLTPHQVMHVLQRAGVPAAAVQNSEDLFRDRHLRERGFIVEVDDEDTGSVEYPGLFVRLSDTPGDVERCHRFAEDNEAVFGKLLGMSPNEVQRLEQAGVLA